jgi:acetyl esterase/lipase
LEDGFGAKGALPRTCPAVTAARSPLAYLNAIVPKDAGTARIASAVPFGPHARHRLDLYAPVRPTAPLPLLFFIYGGGWFIGRRQEYSAIGRMFAKLGFLVAVADYRLFPEVKFPSFVEDSGLALDWFIRNAAAHGGDANRIVLAGQSSGAYNAMMLALQPERFGVPPLQGRLTGFVGLAGPYDFYPFDVKVSIDAFSGVPEPELTQPINLDVTGAPPMFLAHGDKDTSVGPYHTVRFAKKLREAGIPVVEKHYPGRRHENTILDLLLPLRWTSPLYRDMAAFLESVKQVAPAAA